MLTPGQIALGLVLAALFLGLVFWVLVPPCPCEHCTDVRERESRARLALDAAVAEKASR